MNGQDILTHAYDDPATVSMTVILAVSHYNNDVGHIISIACMRCGLQPDGDPCGNAVA